MSDTREDFPDDWDDDDCYEPVRPAVSPRHQVTLHERIANVVGGARVNRRLSQTRLAELAEVAPSTVSRLERGVGHTSFVAVERIMEAMGLQLRIEAEPWGTDFDDEILRYRNLPPEELVRQFDYFARVLQKIGTLPYVISGRLAALAQGAPVSVEFLDLAVAREDLDGYGDLFHREVWQRWDDRLQAPGFGHAHPGEAGPLRWACGTADLRLEIHDALPRAVTLQVGDRCFPVRPLPDVEQAYPDVVTVLRRARQLGSGD